MARRFRSSKWKFLAALIGIGTLVGMGLWQLDRLQWKTQLLKTMHERQELPTLDRIPPNTTDYTTLDFRRANLTGLIDQQKMIFLGPRTFNGQAGYHYLSPMTLADGRVVLVNEGFIPAEYAKKAFPSPQVQSLSGTLRLPPLPGPFTPVNPPVYDHINGDKYFWLDMRAIGDAIGTTHLLPVVFELDKIGSDYPIGGQTQLDLPNDHLQYAITWFALAIILLVIYLLSSFRSDAPRETLEERKWSDGETKYPNIWG